MWGKMISCPEQYVIYFKECVFTLESWGVVWCFCLMCTSGSRLLVIFLFEFDAFSLINPIPRTEVPRRISPLTLCKRVQSAIIA